MSANETSSADAKTTRRGGRVIHAADLFCGAGGTSTGLARACRKTGTRYDLLAINHWDVAVATHERNHPEARHLCESIENVRPTEVIPGGRLDLLVASPSCTHFSTARGGKPVNDQLRAQPWMVHHWLTELDVRNVLIENVPDIVRWGKLSKHTKRPVKSLEGHYFTAWRQGIQALGYTVDYRFLNAADYGGATSRRRFFLLARKGKRPIHWPEPTHSDPRAPRPGTMPWRRARDVLDWSLRGASIFTRDRPLSYLTILRISQGMWALNGIDISPWVKAAYAPCDECGSCAGRLTTGTLVRHQRGKGTCPGSGAPVRAYTPDEVPVPLRGEPGRARTSFVCAMGSGGAPRTVEMPLPTIVAKGGGSFVEPFLLHTTHGGRLHDANKPMPTVTGASRGELAVAEPFITKFYGTSSHTDVDGPLPTVTAQGGHLGVAEPFILPPLGVHARDGKANAPRSLDDPVQTLTQRGGGHVVESFVTSIDRPLTNRSLPNSLDLPIPAATGQARIGVVDPFIVPNFGEGETQAPRFHPVEDPVPTVTQRGAGNLVEPYLVQYNGESTYASVDAPVPGLTTRHRQGLVLPEIILDDGTRAKLDIRFRMLEPHELARAMGFPDDYVFTGTKTENVKLVGNAVEVNIAEALCAGLLGGNRQRVLDVLGDEPSLEVTTDA